MEEYEEWWSPSSDAYDEDRATRLLELLEKELVAADATFPRETPTVIRYDDGTLLHFGWGPFEDEEVRDMFYELSGDGFYITFRRTLPQPGADVEIIDELWLEDDVEGDDRARKWLVKSHERTYLDWETFCKLRDSAK